MHTMLDTGTAYRKNSHDGNGTAAMVKAVNKIAAITNTAPRTAAAHKYENAGWPSWAAPLLQ